jgi:tRNA threonylcarbamoyladenosine biosynthesis protein TsaE
MPGAGPWKERPGEVANTKGRAGKGQAPGILLKYWMMLAPLAPESLIVDLPNLDATMAFGRRLGGLLFPGAVVALVGELGAGKTHLARAIAEGLGVADGRVVTSPTFVLVQEYQGRLPINHFDAYRLRAEGEFADLGAAEYFEAGGVCLVEWADRVWGCLPAEHLGVTLTITGETTRRALVEARGRRYEALVAAMR